MTQPSRSENIHRQSRDEQAAVVAILDGAHQIATPTFIGTLSICIVFFFRWCC